MRSSLFAVIIVLLLFLPGCSMEHVENRLAEASQQLELMEGDVAELRAIKPQLDELLASLPEGEARDAVQARADQVDALLTQAETILPELRASLDSADGDPLAAVEGGVGAVAPLLPPPWGAVAVGVAGLAAGLIRAGRTRTVARRVIQSVDGLVKPSNEDAVRISAEQGAEGKRLVDEAEGKRVKLPF